ncbi:Signal transduction histidine kinase [Nocardioides terrae]|uniref:histidine kinase n=1 Tax=Nocardioides terrae TaxID=574651 RepID=A0A1I1JKM6_9ACTN|nr:histidine kinase [Nocardioides terrae]SFC49104.1 Signal transduction histidine kinase [Nocardioides terrae]
MSAVLGQRSLGHAPGRSAQAADAGLAALLVIVLLPVSARTLWGSSWPTALQGLGVGALVVGHGAVGVRRLVPRAAFATGAVLVAFLVATPPLDPGEGSGAFSAILVPSVLVYPVLLYTVGAWCSHRTSMWALALSVAGGGLVVARLWGSDYLTVAQPGLASDEDPVRSWPLFLLLGLLVVVILPWCAGRYRRLRVLYVLELEERARRDDAERRAQARRAVEEDRRRIAREMHDVVAHSLSIMVSQAEGGRAMAAKDPAVAAPVLDTIAQAGREAMHDMGSVLRVLDPPEDGGSRPVADPQPGLADLPALVSQVRRSGLDVVLEETGTRRRLSAAAELAAYRFTQEALTNVLKHAGPQPGAHVALRWRARSLELLVTNDVDPERRPAGGSGRGLRGMQERLAAIGGSVRVTDSADAFVVRALVPVAAKDR